MNAAHLHILVNHMPMAFAIMALFTMIVGFIGRNVSIKKLSLGMLVCVALAGVAAYFTGGAAEDSSFGEGSGYEERVEPHEEAAEVSWILGIVAGVVGLAALLLTKRMQEFPAAFMVVSLLVLLVSMYFFAKTANLGGHIMHPETRGDGISKFLNPPRE